MGNFHCIPSSCGTVIYREYLPPVVRWRYPGEDWQEIEGDDYTVEQKKGQCYAIYKVTGEYTRQSLNFSGVSECGITYGWYIKRDIPGKIINIEFHPEYPVIFFDTVDKNNIQRPRLGYQMQAILPNGTIGGPIPVVFQECNDSFKGYAGNNFRVTDISRVDGGADNCGDCIFTITNNSQIIHQETRDTCPEVEKLPCRLSDVTKKIKIEKIPYLERIEVRSEGIDYISLLPPILQGYDIPEECLNIYLTYTLAPPIISEYKPIPGVTNPYQFIQQICSVPGCPPPKYEVICDCNDCESCPENTCVVECEGNICCYDKVTGKSIKSIPIDNYCGDELTVEMNYDL